MSVSLVTLVTIKRDMKLKTIVSTLSCQLEWLLYNANLSAFVIYFGTTFSKAQWLLLAQKGFSQESFMAVLEGPYGMPGF